MPASPKKRPSRVKGASLFDPRGDIAFPRRLAVLGSVHANQIFGLVHGDIKARVQVVPKSERGLHGFTTDMPGSTRVLLAPRKTSVRGECDATLVVPGFKSADELFDPSRQSRADWHLPRPINPTKESVEDSEARCDEIVRSWAGAFKFEQEDPASEKRGLRRPQIGALYATLAHWSTSEDPATVVMPTGTGKTETMLALLVGAQLRRVMVVVPNSALRDQIAEKFITLGKLAECGCVPGTIRPPVVARLRRRPKSIAEVDAVFRRANVIVSTMQVAGQCSPEIQKRMAQLCSHLFIDEAHHIAARSWTDFKTQFLQRPILQFTATPFRTDGKRVDGRFIYSYPLARAQREGYFRKVQFIPIEEYDPSDADQVVADRAGQLLRSDLKAGFDHLLMARVDTTERADEIERLYAERLPDFRPVAIHTKIPAQERKRRLDQLRDRKSRILICVDMFGEGFDLPQLKIAALHDKHKSLAITLQFVGRFTRGLVSVGDAKVVANIADEAISNALRNLYAEDADWNFLIKMLADAATGKARKRNEVLSGFTNTLPEIPLQVLAPRMSAVVYRTTCDEWSPMKIADVITGATLHAGPVVNPEARLAVFVTRDEEPVRWGAVKQIQDVEWNLHVLHWNETQKLLFINSSSKDFHERIAKEVGGSDERIVGTTVYRAMGRIKRLVLTNLGLHHAFGKNIRYTKFMGADIGEGLTESAKQNRRMSDVFGLGYEDDERATVGCSFKGRLWSYKIAHDLSEFTEWCAHIGGKLLDDEISIDSVLGNLIKARAIDKRPPLAPIMVVWPEGFLHEPEDRVVIELGSKKFELFDCAIEPESHNEDGPLCIRVSAGEEVAVFEVLLSAEKAEFKQIRGSAAFGSVRNKRRPLVEIFNEDPPIVHFATGDFLVFNELFELPKRGDRASFDVEKIDGGDWKGVDLRKESQGAERDPKSIQRHVIERILSGEFGEWNIVFDGDGKGEVADIVALRREGERVVVGLWHCKYSQSDDPGARIGDLYEVCGQAQKCVHWRESPRRMLRHLMHQEDVRIKSGRPTRFEVGTRTDVQRILYSARQLAFEYHVFVVQPGLSKGKVNAAFLDVLGATEAFLQETFSMPLRVLASR